MADKRAEKFLPIGDGLSAAELRDHRERIRAELEAGDLHLFGVLRNPAAVLRSALAGDVLCWADGLDEEKVSRILAAVDIPWGRRISVLTEREIQTLCLQIKVRHPETWQRWRDAMKARA